MSAEETEDEVREIDPEEFEEPPPISGSEFDAEVRRLIDIAIQSGIDPSSVEESLERHLNGVEYYYVDARRYTQQIREDEDE